MPDVVYEVWISTPDDASEDTLVVLASVNDLGQKLLLDSNRFGPFEDQGDIATWVWYRLRGVRPAR